MRHRLLAGALLVGFVAGLILGVAGCAARTKGVQGDNQSALIAAIVKTEVDAAMSLNTGPITGVNYQSVLPIGMVVLLTILTLKDAAILLAVVVLSHRREMLRLKHNGAGRSPLTDSGVR